MGQTGNKPGSPAKETAFCGMTAALSAVFLMLSGLIQALGYIGPMLASFLLLPIEKSFGPRPAFLTYLVTSLLVLILGADKEAALFYVFFGYYPVLKPWFDRILQALVRRTVKFAWFLGAAVLMDVLLIKLLGITLDDQIPPELADAAGVSPHTLVILWEGLFCLMVAGTMAMLDVVLTRAAQSKLCRRICGFLRNFERIP